MTFTFLWSLEASWCNALLSALFVKEKAQQWWANSRAQGCFKIARLSKILTRLLEGNTAKENFSALAQMLENIET